MLFLLFTSACKLLPIMTVFTDNLSFKFKVLKHYRFNNEYNCMHIQ